MHMRLISAVHMHVCTVALSLSLSGYARTCMLVRTYAHTHTLTKI
jgi:hypothetical protein